MEKQFTLTYYIENPFTVVSMIEKPDAFEAFKSSEIIPDYDNRDIIGGFNNKQELVEMLTDNNYWFADHEAEAETEAKKIMDTMMERLKNSYGTPTKEDIIAYLKSQGYPNVETDDKWMIYSFIRPDNYERRFQFWQAVREDIDLTDFDRWQHFENVIGRMISYEDFRTIDNIFCEYDIEVLEIPSPRKTIW